MTNALATKPRFSGHETFACRFSWLPKGVRLIESDAAALADDQVAILSLGLGWTPSTSRRWSTDHGP